MLKHINKDLLLSFSGAIAFTFLSLILSADPHQNQHAFIRTYLENVEVYDIHENHGLLWVGTEIGLFTFDGKSLVQYTHDDFENNGAFIGVFKDALNRLWVVSAHNKVYVIDKGVLFHSGNSDWVPDYLPTLVLTFASNANYTVFTSQDIIYRLNHKTNKLETFYLDHIFPEIAGGIKSSYISKDNRVYFTFTRFEYVLDVNGDISQTKKNVEVSRFLYSKTPSRYFVSVNNEILPVEEISSPNSQKVIAVNIPKSSQTACIDSSEGVWYCSFDSTIYKVENRKLIAVFEGKTRLTSFQHYGDYLVICTLRRGLIVYTKPGENFKIQKYSASFEPSVAAESDDLLLLANRNLISISDKVGNTELIHLPPLIEISNVIAYDSHFLIQTTSHGLICKYDRPKVFKRNVLNIYKRFRYSVDSMKTVPTAILDSSGSALVSLSVKDMTLDPGSEKVFVATHNGVLSFYLKDKLRLRNETETRCYSICHKNGRLLLADSKGFRTLQAEGEMHEESSSRIIRYRPKRLGCFKKRLVLQTADSIFLIRESKTAKNYLVVESQKKLPSRTVFQIGGRFYGSRFNTAKRIVVFDSNLNAILGLKLSSFIGPAKLLYFKLTEEVVKFYTSDGLYQYRRDAIERSTQNLAKPKVYLIKSFGTDAYFPESYVNLVSKSTFARVYIQNMDDKNGIQFKLEDGSWNDMEDGKIDFFNLKLGSMVIKLRQVGPSGATSEEVSFCINRSYTFMNHPATLLTTSAVLILFIIYFLALSMRKKKEERSLYENLLKARISVYQLQMNPHFVFNALQSISSLVIKQKKNDALRYISRFAGLLRNNLQNTNEFLVPFKQELEELVTYIEIEKLRFKNPFKVEIKNHVKDDFLIPPMIMQPVVENAIWHGLSGAKSGPNLVISTHELNNNRIEVRIDDNGPGIKNQDDEKVHALKILANRVENINRIKPIELKVGFEHLTPGTRVKLQLNKLNI
jgi:hypothetical protein